MIKDFSIVKNGYFCLFSGLKDDVSNTFFFQCPPKTFHCCIIIAIAFPTHTHTHLNIVLLQECLIALARIFTASVWVVHQASSRLPLDERHVQCFLHQSRIMFLAHRPPPACVSRHRARLRDKVIPPVSQWRSYPSSMFCWVPQP